MWILILIIITSNGEFVAYDQGIYETWNECHTLKTAMLEELGKSYRATCVEW